MANANNRRTPCKFFWISVFVEVSIYHRVRSYKRIYGDFLFVILRIFLLYKFTIEIVHKFCNLCRPLPIQTFDTYIIIAWLHNIWRSINGIQGRLNYIQHSEQVCM